MPLVLPDSFKKFIGDSSLIEKLDPLAFGKGEENTFVGSFRRLLQATDRDVPYWYLMGICGAAFRLQIHRNSWRMNSPDLICGSILTQHLFHAFAMEYEQIWVCGDRERMEYAHQKLSESLKNNMPVIGLGMDGKNYHGIVISQQPGGTLLALDYSIPGYPHAVVQKMVWCYHVINGTRKQISDRDQLKQAFSLALELVTEKRMKSFHQGLDAYQYWHDTLVNPQHHNPYDDDWRSKEKNNGNHWIMVSLIDARTAAARFCRECAETIPDISGTLTDLAVTYESVIELLQPFITKQIVRPDNKISLAWPWTLHQRRKQAKALKEAQALEEATIPHLKSIIAALT